MSLDPGRDLSPRAVEALDGLAREDSRSELLEDAALLDLLRGATDPKDLERTASLISRSAEARRRLVGLHRTGTSLPDPQGRDLARAVVELALTLTPEHWDSVAGSREPRFVGVRDVLRTIVRNAQVAFAAPRFATSRGEAQRRTAGLQALVGSEGDLLAQVTVHGAQAEGRAARIELIDPLGGGFPVATARLHGGRWEFRVPRFGAATGLPMGSLPSGLFRLRVDGEEAEGREPGALWVIDEEGDLLVLEMADPPQVSDDRLTVAVRIPEDVRATYEGKELRLLLSVGTYECSLGTWSISEMETVSTLSIDAIDLPNGTLPFGSMVKGRILDDGALG